MECIYLGSMKNPTTGLWLSYPCGQCLACRVRKQSSWTLRNLLECQTALSSAFWTLTFSDDNLHVLDDHSPRQLSRRFLDALRTSESRAQNSTPIRFFGAYEYGGQLGRPHFHLLLYNVIANSLPSSKRSDGLPSERYHIGPWPYGHIDVGTVTKASIRYCTDYMTNFDKEASEAIQLKTIRPAIGFYGLQRLVATIAARHTSLPSNPAFFKIGERSYPLDQWTRSQFSELWKKTGNRFSDAQDPLDRKMYALQFTAQKLKEDNPRRQALLYQKKETEMELAHAQKENREIAITSRYEKLVGRSIPDPNPDYAPPRDAEIIETDIPFFT